MTHPTSDTRQDRNGRYIRIGSTVHDHHHRVDGVVEKISSMAWITTKDGERFGVNYDDLEVLPDGERFGVNYA